MATCAPQVNTNHAAAGHRRRMTQSVAVMRPGISALPHQARAFGTTALFENGKLKSCRRGSSVRRNRGLEPDGQTAIIPTHAS
jgi:hypothetical protein